ncbi:MAG: hypothetical protein ABI586_10810 [Candidatus Nanopelagicales bacterium]
MTRLELADGSEAAGLCQYLERLVALDNRAVVRLQAGGAAMGVWSGPPFEVVALKPVALNGIGEIDATVSAQRLLDRVDGVLEFDLPDTVPGPSWVGLLPPRSGWEERSRGDVANVRASIDSAKHFFRQRATDVADQKVLQDIANDVWERTCIAEVPVRSAHAAESLGLLGPADGEVVAFATPSWTRLAAPGGSVATRRGLLPSIPVFALN